MEWSGVEWSGMSSVETKMRREELRWKERRTEDRDGDRQRVRETETKIACENDTQTVEKISTEMN